MKSIRLSNPFLLLAGLITLAVFAWSYWTTIGDLRTKWATDPLYSHGYLVPLVSLILLWSRRSLLDVSKLQFSAWGVPLILLAACMRLAGTYYYAMLFDGLSMIPCLIGICLVFGGWHALRYAWPAVAFLLYTLPLPYRVEMDLGYPMQRIATVMSIYALQTFGFAAIGEGNVITFNETQIGIVEACSGLRMLVVFFAVATAVALIVRRPLPQRAIILLSAIPIALFTNVARITITGILHDQLRNPAINETLHDFAGFLMMPVAFALLGLELWVLSRSVVDELTDRVPVRA